MLFRSVTSVDRTSAAGNACDDAASLTFPRASASKHVLASAASRSAGNGESDDDVVAPGDARGDPRGAGVARSRRRSSCAQSCNRNGNARALLSLPPPWQSAENDAPVANRPMSIATSPIAMRRRAETASGRPTLETFSHHD